MRRKRNRFDRRFNIGLPTPSDARRLSQPALKKRVAGAIAKRSGEQFEDEVEATCNRYRRSGVALFARSRPKTGGPPGKMYFVERGQVDFVGHWQGVPVAFDTKSDSSDPASWRFHERDLFQAEWLRDWQRAGGIAFVLLRTRPRDRQEIVYILRDVDALARGEAVQLRTRQDRSKGRAGVAVTRLVPYFEYHLAFGWDFLRTLNQLIEVHHDAGAVRPDGERLEGGAAGGFPAVQDLRQSDARGAVRPDEEDHRPLQP